MQLFQKKEENCGDELTAVHQYNVISIRNNQILLFYSISGFIFHKISLLVFRILQIYTIFSQLGINVEMQLENLCDCGLMYHVLAQKISSPMLMDKWVKFATILHHAVSVYPERCICVQEFGSQHMTKHLLCSVSTIRR